MLAVWRVPGKTELDSSLKSSRYAGCDFSGEVLDMVYALVNNSHRAVTALAGAIIDKRDVPHSVRG